MNTPPLDEEFVRCRVCGQWVNAERTQQPEQTPTVYTVVGTVWDSPDLTLIDKSVTPVVPAYGACWFCGSGRWRDGDRGTL